MCLSVVPTLAFLPVWTPGGGEMLLLAVIALLLYGGDLPKAARSWGRAFGEFRRHLAGVQRDLNQAIYSEPELLEYHSPRNTGTAGETPSVLRSDDAVASGAPDSTTLTPEADALQRD